MAEWIEFEERAAAATRAADFLAAVLRETLAEQASATLVVSGGSTPGPCLQILSQATLPWSRVSVVPSDERCVPPDHADSNIRMIREHLDRGGARAAEFVCLHDDEAESRVDALAWPSAAALIGMGADGHFASLFPDFDDLQAALSRPHARRTVAVRTAASPHPRISLTLDTLASTRCGVMLFFGAEKRAVYERAAAGAVEYPVTALLAATDPLRVVWAP